jgi:hypothetical protein
LRLQVAGEKFHHALLLAEFHDWVVAACHVRAKHGHEFIRFSGHEQSIAKLKGMLGVHVVIGEAMNEEKRPLKFGCVA